MYKSYYTIQVVHKTNEPIILYYVGMAADEPVALWTNNKDNATRFAYKDMADHIAKEHFGHVRPIFVKVGTEE